MLRTREEFATFRSKYRSLSRIEFVKRFPHPFLLVSRVDEEEQEDVGFRTMAIHTRKNGVKGKRIPGDLYPITKDDGSMTTIGRATNNDVVLDDGRVSKLHAYMKKDRSGSFNVVDTGSKNGTRVNGRRLEKQVPSHLEGGDNIQFGTVFEATFHTPQSLYLKLRIG